jgi:excisionase family DNA binding protein
VPTTTDLITSAQASRIIGIHHSTVLKWVKAGRLTPAMKVPGLRGPMLFAREDVERLADAA